MSIDQEREKLVIRIVDYVENIFDWKKDEHNDSLNEANYMLKLSSGIETLIRDIAHLNAIIGDKRDEKLLEDILIYQGHFVRYNTLNNIKNTREI